MTDYSVYDQAATLTTNLAAAWNGGHRALNRLMASARDPSGTPWQVLLQLGSTGAEALFGSPGALDELEAASLELRRYFTEECWFERSRSRDARLQALDRRPIAYFCAEFALASWFPIYSGGLGVLAGDTLKESSDLGLPFVGVGLLYRNGFFQQQLDGSKRQSESPQPIDPAQLPLRLLREADSRPVLVSVPIAERQVFACIWIMEIGRTPLFLLDTDLPENQRREDREITASLYGGDQETRIKQELVLGIGGVRALRAMRIDPGLYAMNEGHSAFLSLELLAETLTTSSFDAALQRNRSRIVYTNHTIVPAGNDVFPRGLIEAFVGPFAEKSGIGRDRLLDLAVSSNTDDFSMAALAFETSGKANAVSHLHAEVIPREWPGFDVEAVTNGVHVPTWLGPDMLALIASYVPDWRSDQPDWDLIRTIPDVELWQAHERQRTSMVKRVNQARSGTKFEPGVLTLVWARRFAEYKRPGLLFSDLPRLVRILTDPARPVQVIFSGKAHPRDGLAKDIMRDLIDLFESDHDLAARAAFVTDYNLNVAGSLTAGADVWINTPRRPFEASGTSGMKASDNGALQLTVCDGWAAEVDWWGTGWAITGAGDAEDAEQLYGYLEEAVVPLFYDRQNTAVPDGWVAMMKNTMVLTLSRYSTRRMLLEYLDCLYLPLLAEQAESNRTRA